MKSVTENAREIVRRSGSNLAFALAVLPKDKRDDMGVFYAFCRVADDIADDPGYELEERREGLARWRSIIRDPEFPVLDGIETEFREMMLRRNLNLSELEEIIDGVEMDLSPLRFETAADLQRYCYHVASAVGLVSIQLFGYSDPQTRVYAEQLGYALQWTNIMRDVGEDAREGRIFLPLEDLRQFGISEKNLLAETFDEESFAALMAHQDSKAIEFYTAAKEALPEVDRSSMRSAELMNRIYSGILCEMRKDGYRVFEKRYRLSKPRMIFEFLKAKFCF